MPVAVNANDPVGFGGFRTSKASRRRSKPNLKVCRRRTIVNVSSNSVTDVVNLELAAVVGPICCRPVTVKLLRHSLPELPFYEPEDFESLIEGASEVGPEATAAVLLGAERALRLPGFALLSAP